MAIFSANPDFQAARRKTIAYLPIVAITLGFWLILSGCDQSQAADPPGASAPAASTSGAQSAFLGFDRNGYPGDAAVPRLRDTFHYAGYWLNNPPGESSNSWIGKRAFLKSRGFGFAVLFNGRLAQGLKGPNRASLYGLRDGKQAVASARKEGFPLGTVIFLDQEQGGRLLKEQRAYLHAWVDTVNASGYRAGVYCSGIGYQEPESQETIVTASDIRQNAGGRKIVYWVYNDVCAPSPGCAFPKTPPLPSASGTDFAEIWQYAQSPKRPESNGCPKNYNDDGNCYVPGPSSQAVHLDVNTATSPDPSHGR